MSPTASKLPGNTETPAAGVRRGTPDGRSPLDWRRGPCRTTRLGRADGVSPGDVESGDAPALRRRGPAGEHRRGARRTLQPRFHEPLMAEARERDGQVAGVAGAAQGTPRGGLELETGHEPARQGS